MPTPPEPWFQPPTVERIVLIFETFQKLRGENLLDANAHEIAAAAFEAPFPIISHNTDDDPILVYGNRAALDLWEMDWATLTKTPSRKTAEPVAREERAELLRQVTEHGFINDYRGVRISASGRRFEIERAFVWNLVDENGTYHGQAATFKEYRFL